MRKMTFALCFCNRGFMPGELIYGAREDMVKAVTDVFTQYQMPFTVLKPHVVHPLSEKFAENLRDFAAVCRVVNGMKRCNIGCIGARTTASKTVRFDEIAMQKYGINVESFDLSELNDRGITEFKLPTSKKKKSYISTATNQSYQSISQEGKDHE